MQTPVWHNPKILLKRIFERNFMCLTLAIASMFFMDQIVSQYFFYEMQDVRGWAREITNLGLSEHYFVGSILMFLYFRFLAGKMKHWQDRPRLSEYLKKWALNGFVALITSGILIHLIKFLVGRQRPHKTAPFFDPFIFEPFNIHWHWQSFPSGHSQTIFTVATMMNIAFPKYKYLWISLAVCICLTRVIGHDHFLSDTIFGACVGYTGTMLALYLMNKYTKNGI